MATKAKENGSVSKSHVRNILSGNVRHYALDASDCDANQGFESRVSVYVEAAW